MIVWKIHMAKDFCSTPSSPNHSDPTSEHHCSVHDTGSGCGARFLPHEALRELLRRLSGEQGFEVDGDEEIRATVLRTARTMADLINHDPRTRKPPFLGPPMPPQAFTLMLEAMRATFAARVPRRQGGAVLAGVVFLELRALVERKAHFERLPGMAAVERWLSLAESKLRKANTRRRDPGRGGRKVAGTATVDVDQIRAAPMPDAPDAWQSLDPEWLVGASRDLENQIPLLCASEDAVQSALLAAKAEDLRVLQQALREPAPTCPRATSFLDVATECAPARPHPVRARKSKKGEPAGASSERVRKKRALDRARCRVSQELASKGFQPAP